MRAICLALLVAGCSAEQAYHAGRGWQQNQCMRIADKAEYDRCMAGAGQSYDSYKRESERR